jgi:DNA-binding transcriptional MerR regulator
MCFKEKTLILCLMNKKLRYLPIECLNKFTYVYTKNDGFKRIKYLIKMKLLNTSIRTINKLYIMKNKNNLIKDLYVTGSHAILKDKLSEVENKKMTRLLENIKEYKYNRLLDGKEKVIACFDNNFEQHNEQGYFNIYHIVLENNGDVEKNYGIYANGLLVESTNEKTMKKDIDIELINL